MKKYMFLIGSIFLSLPMLNYASSCATSCDTKGACKRKFFIGTKKIELYSNFPLNKNNSCINKVVYVIHGTSRTAENYYLYALNAAKSQGKQDSTLIIAPFFKISADDPASNDYYWTNDGWKRGDSSVNSGTKISSYAVTDTLTDTIISSNLFPSLAHIDVSGHSAGGQYTQLYSLTTPNPDLHPLLSYRFFVMNPSNYSYLNNLRPSPSVVGLYESPVILSGGILKMKPEYLAEAGNCPTTYDHYKYGLQNRNPYASQFPIAGLITQFIKRKVYYFLGELDINQNDDELDKSCPAQLEGAYRLIRGQKFFNFLNQFYPTNQHNLGVVPDVAHDANGMYNSTAVKTVLFN